MNSADDEIDAWLLGLLSTHGEAWMVAAYNVLGDWHRAEDAMSEAVEALGGALRGAEEIVDPVAWMYTAVRNRARMRLRSETSHRRRVESLPALSGENGVAGSEEDAAVPELDREAVWAAMPGLAPRQREVIDLRLFEGLTIRETAGRMGCSESRVRTTQTKAIRALQNRLTSNGESGYDP